MKRYWLVFLIFLIPVIASAGPAPDYPENSAISAVNDSVIGIDNKNDSPGWSIQQYPFSLIKSWIETDVDVYLKEQSLTTAGLLGRTASNEIVMGDGSSIVTFAPVDDAASDTHAVWSANKVSSELSTKQDTLTAAQLTKLSRYHQVMQFDANVMYDSYGGVLVVDDYTDAAITISRLHVTLNEDPTTELLFTAKFKASGVNYSGGTVIGSGTTTAGILTVDSGWTDNTIPAGSKIWLEIGTSPDATTVNCSASLTGSYD